MQALSTNKARSQYQRLPRPNIRKTVNVSRKVRAWKRLEQSGNESTAHLHIGFVSCHIINVKHLDLDYGFLNKIVVMVA